MAYSANYNMVTIPQSITYQEYRDDIGLSPKGWEPARPPVNLPLLF